MSQLTNTFSDLLPFQIQSPHSIVNFYSFNGTGFAGRLAAFETGNQDPALSAGDFSNATAGASVEGTWSYRYEVPRKVRYAAYGDNRFAVAGLILDATVEYDEHGRKVILLDEPVKKEKQIVSSGEAIRLATDGVYTIKQAAYLATPFPGYVGVVTGSVGQLTFVSPATAQPYIQSGLGVCKVLSTSGSAFGGYAQIQLTLT
jgi:hypothetical protein